MSYPYRARLNVSSVSIANGQAGQGAVELYVEASEVPGIAAEGECDWLWIYRNVENWNPLTRNELRLYYYEYQGTAWRIAPNNPPPCVVAICPKSE